MSFNDIIGMNHHYFVELQSKQKFIEMMQNYALTETNFKLSDGSTLRIYPVVESKSKEIYLQVIGGHHKRLVYFVFTWDLKKCSYVYSPTVNPKQEEILKLFVDRFSVIN